MYLLKWICLWKNMPSSLSRKEIFIHLFLLMHLLNNVMTASQLPCTQSKSSISSPAFSHFPIQLQFCYQPDKFQMLDFTKKTIQRKIINKLQIISKKFWPSYSVIFWIIFSIFLWRLLGEFDFVREKRWGRILRLFFFLVMFDFHNSLKLRNIVFL